jgi:PAS domain S-box-containing protein
MHPALARPVRRYLGDAPLPREVEAVLASASAALDDMERDRAMSMRTMDELSRELEERFAKVRASEARYKRLFDGVPHPTFVLRRIDRIIVDWNAAAERTFGWTASEVLGSCVDTLRLWQPTCRFAANLESDTPIELAGLVETNLRAHDMRLIDGEIQGLDILLGDVPAVLVMVRDVTAQRAAERAERESAARFQAFFDYAGIAIQVLSTSGTILQANPACHDMLGYAPEEMVGRPIGRFLASDDAAGIVAACTELISTARESMTLEQRFAHKDGSIIWTTDHRAGAGQRRVAPDGDASGCHAAETDGRRAGATRIPGRPDRAREPRTVPRSAASRARLPGAQFK